MAELIATLCGFRSAAAACEFCARVGAGSSIDIQGANVHAGVVRARLASLTVRRSAEYKALIRIAGASLLLVARALRRVLGTRCWTRITALSPTADPKNRREKGEEGDQTAEHAETP